MLRAAICLILLPLFVASQDSRSRALESLEPLPGLIALTPPAVQAPLLLETARIWARLDKSRAIELLEQATAASGVLSPLERNLILGNIAAELVLLDTRRAADLLALLPITPNSKSTSHAVQAHAEVISALLREKRCDAALEIANASGALRFLNVSYSILDALPKDYPARPSILAAALPSLGDPGNFGSSIAFLEKYLDEFPPPSIANARSAIFAALSAKPESKLPLSATFSNANGSIRLTDIRQSNAFQYATFLRSFDPAAWKQYLGRDPRFAALIAQYPNGADSFNEGAEDISMSFAFTEDAPGLPVAASTNEATADDAESIRGPKSRLEESYAAIVAAYDRERPALARQSAQRTLRHAAKLRIRDRISGGNANASVNYWPSTHRYRLLAHLVAKHDPEFLPTLLAETQDPELLLWLHLESARACAGRHRPALTYHLGRPPE